MTEPFERFFRRYVPVEGDYGPLPIIPPFLSTWLALALPGGVPAARNIADLRTKKEGKSTLAAGVALFVATGRPYAEVVIAASDQDQAKDRVFRAAKYAVEHGPLAGSAKVMRDVIEFDNGSLIQAIPSDWQGQAGGNYDLIIFDELHAWIYEGQRRLFDELLPPPSKKHSFRWIASYAGFEGESELLREWWDRALQGERVDDELPIYRHREASLLAFVDVGEASWRMPWMSPEYIAEVRASERPSTFRRIWLNEWVEAESAFLPEGAWEACRAEYTAPRSLVLGADASTSRDHTSLVGVGFNQTTGTTDVGLVRVWRPRVLEAAGQVLRGGRPTVDLEATIGEEVLELHRQGRVLEVLADPYQLHTLILKWQKAGIRVIEFPQTSRRTEADQGLYDAVIGRTLRHPGHPILDEHMRNAVALESIRGFRLAKEKTSKKIDAAVALSMAVWGAQKQGLAGGVRTEPNWFYGAGNREDYIHVGDQWIYAARHKAQHSHPGATWRDCRNRNRGCVACVEEMTREGVYEADAAAAELVKQAGQPEPYTGPDEFQRQEIARHARTIEIFRMAAHNRWLERRGR